MLIGINVVAYVLQLAVGPTVRTALLVDRSARPSTRGSGRSIGVADGEYYRLLTAAFLHGSVVHIALNMYALYLFGPPLEAALGPGPVPRAVPGLRGGRQRRCRTPFAAPSQPSLGASGAVFGLLGAFFVVNRRLGRDTSRLLVLLVINFAFGFIVPEIDWRAHLGGLIAGALCAAAIAYARASPACSGAGRGHRGRAGGGAGRHRAGGRRT